MGPRLCRIWKWREDNFEEEGLNFVLVTRFGNKMVLLCGFLCTKVVHHQLDKEYQGIEEFWKPHHRKRAIVYSYTLLECPTVSERGIVRTIVLFDLLLKLENKISHSASNEVIDLYIYFILWFKLLFTSRWYKKLEFNNVILNCGW